MDMKSVDADNKINKKADSVMIALESMQGIHDKKNAKYDALMERLNEVAEQKGLDPAMSRKLKRILYLENSFMLGLTEVVSNNLDYVFRYIYLIAFGLQVGIQFTI